MKILTFGQIAELTGGRSITVENVESTDALGEMLTKIYPDLQTMDFIVAVDQAVVTENTPLTAGSIVALMPPFSGG